MTIERTPTRFSRGVALAAAGLAVVTALLSPPGVVVAGAGFLGVALGTTRGSRRLLGVGAIALAAGVGLGALADPAVVIPLLGTAGAVVAWDVGENAIAMGEQLGRDSPTRRAEVFHAVASAGVGLLSIALGYALFLAAWGGQPVAALFFTLVAALALGLGLRE